MSKDEEFPAEKLGVAVTTLKRRFVVGFVKEALCPLWLTPAIWRKRLAH